jgi:hypothetical protein
MQVARQGVLKAAESVTPRAPPSWLPAVGTMPVRVVPAACLAGSSATKPSAVVTQRARSPTPARATLATTSATSKTWPAQPLVRPISASREGPSRSVTLPATSRTRRMTPWVCAIVVWLGAGCHRPAPACATGQTRCGVTCTDLPTDPRHCGSCDHACEPGQVCVGGACRTIFLPAHVDKSRPSAQ